MSLRAQCKAIAGGLHAEALEGLNVSRGDAVIVNGLALGIHRYDSVVGVWLPRYRVQDDSIGLQGGNKVAKEKSEL